MIVHPRTNSIVAATERTGRPDMSLDEVEAWLTRDEVVIDGPQPASIARVGGSRR